MHVNKTLSEST